VKYRIEYNRHNWITDISVIVSDTATSGILKFKTERIIATLFKLNFRFIFNILIININHNNAFFLHNRIVNTISLKQ